MNGTELLKCQVQRVYNEKPAISFALDVLQSFIVMLLSRFDGWDWDEIVCRALSESSYCYIRVHRAGDGRRHRLFSFRYILINKRFYIFFINKSDIQGFEWQWIIGCWLRNFSVIMFIKIIWQVRMCFVLYLLLCKWIAATI